MWTAGRVTLIRVSRKKRADMNGCSTRERFSVLSRRRFKCLINVSKRTEGERIVHQVCVSVFVCVSPCFSHLVLCFHRNRLPLIILSRSEMNFILPTACIVYVSCQVYGMEFLLTVQSENYTTYQRHFIYFSALILM